MPILREKLEIGPTVYTEWVVITGAFADPPGKGFVNEETGVVTQYLHLYAPKLGRGNWDAPSFMPEIRMPWKKSSDKPDSKLSNRSYLVRFLRQFAVASAKATGPGGEAVAAPASTDSLEPLIGAVLKIDRVETETGQRTVKVMARYWHPDDPTPTYTSNEDGLDELDKAAYPKGAIRLALEDMRQQFGWDDDAWARAVAHTEEDLGISLGFQAAPQSGPGQPAEARAPAQTPVAASGVDPALVETLAADPNVLTFKSVLTDDRAYADVIVNIKGVSLDVARAVVARVRSQGA